MAYILFLLTNAALFVRPGELFPAMGDVQLYMLLIAATIVCSLQRLHNQVSLRTMVQQPVNLCVAGMVIAVVLSHVTRGEVAAAGTGALMMIKIALYYLLLVALINTPERLRQFLLCTGVCSTLMIALSLNDYFQFVEEWQGRTDLREVFEKERWLPDGEPRLLRHYPDSEGFDGDGNEIWLFRLCGLGMFRDPNDMSLLIAITSIIAAYFLFDRRLGPARWLWLLSLAVTGAAYYYTYSRGGLLALGFAGMVWLATRYGGKVAIALGVMGAAAAPVVLSRHASISISSDTGQDRIQAWSDGLVLLKSSRLFFGIGEGEYGNAVGLVAHNSYIHSFVELGFFGGALFFGCFFFPAYAIYRMKRTGMRIPHPELARLFPYIAAILAGWCMGMASLSRCYVPPTYLVAGIAAAYLNLAGYHRERPEPLQTFNWHTAQRWGLCSAGLLACCFLFIKVFARYSGG